MIDRPFVLTPLALAALLIGAADAAAQVPPATGIEVALSRPEWKLWTPTGFVAPSDGRVNLLIHFHGDPRTVRNNAAYADLDVAVVTVNYSGLSSAYRRPFEDASLFGQLLEDARQGLRSQPGFGPSVDWDRLAVSSFSAGYGAVREVLKTPAYFDAIDGLLAADSIYASTASDGTPVDSQMVDFKRFADRAAAGDKRFVFTHSQVATPGYESTVETGDELLQHLGLPAQPTNETGLGPLRYYRKASRGGFKLWGARGADAEGHLNHLRYLGEWLDDLGLSATTPAGDFNADGVVDAADYTVWRDNWLRFGAPGDADADGFVGNSDYAIWAAGYGESSNEPPRLRAVPEVSAAGPCLVGVLVALRHRPNGARECEAGGGRRDA